LLSTVKPLISKLEEELESAKSKKPKGTQKKLKEKVGSLNYKLTLAKKVKDKLDELSLQMDFADGGAIKTLRTLLRNYVDNPDEEYNKNSIDAEVSKILEKIDNNKKNLN
jgi:hypothetical protein